VSAPDTSVYLDFAATSALRPPVVGEAVAEFLGNCGATPGRSGHHLAVEAGRMALRCRMALARLLGISGDPGRIAWMLNATHAVNTALHGALRARDAVVITSFDHNAVLRPAHQLATQRGVHVRMVRGARDGSIDLDEIRKAVEGARVLVINAASNVLGTRLPIAELTAIAHEVGAYALVDSAQLAGHGEIDAQRDGIDMLAITGHKGLLGPQGIGALWVREGIEIEPLLTGGTGGRSIDADMPAAYPDHLEAGTQNGPGIAGLLAGIEWIEERGVDALHKAAFALKKRLREGLAAIDGLEVLSPLAPDGVALVTVRSNRSDPASMARRLDEEFGIMTRHGLHCAPEVHRLLGTEVEGALRFSIGWCTTEAEIDHTIEAMSSILRDAENRVPVAAGGPVHGSGIDPCA
jgi:cysteine desulfurase/selenocysteine lyase